ncbi:hypothetical protein BSNK01_10500 [Bacillaceae bacterium]
MTIRYLCRCCGSKIGEIEASVPEMKLGFHFLTPEERQHIISYEADGDITVRIICEYCSEALEQNPELSLLSTPIQ